MSFFPSTETLDPKGKKEKERRRPRSVPRAELTVQSTVVELGWTAVVACECFLLEKEKKRKGRRRIEFFK